MEYKDLEKVNKEIGTIDVKGKQYAEVPQRIKAFRKLFPNGSIETEIVSLDDHRVVMKCVVKNEEGRVLSTAHAYENEGSSFINKTSFIENCVPITTQILTRDGWKYYYQLKEGEEVFSYNMATGKNEYCHVTKINYYSNRPLVNLKTTRFNATCTPQHKWLVRGQYQELHKEQTCELKKTQKIVQAIPQETPSSVIGQKLGWLMCDCTISYLDDMPSSACISQSKYIKDITNLFGEGKKTKKRNSLWKDNYVWNIPANVVREILGNFNMKSYKDLERAMLTASLEDVKGCFESMMKADGSRGRFYSTYPELIQAMQVMCVRLGIATSFVTASSKKNSTKPLYTLGIKKTDGAYVSELKITHLPPRDVWCPTTENGTWFMKEGDFITLTSNCCTSCTGRALGYLGIGIDTSVASFEEVANAQLQQTAEAPINKAKLDTIKALKIDPDIAKSILGSYGYTKSTEIKNKDFADIFETLKNCSEETTND